MSDCRCHAGKICDLHVEGVMDNLNKAYVPSVQGETGAPQLAPLAHPTPEGTLPDLPGEIVKLCLRVKDLEDAININLGLIENLARRLNEAEDKLEAIEEPFLHFIELRKIRGTG